MTVSTDGAWAFDTIASVTEASLAASYNNLPAPGVGFKGWTRFETVVIPNGFKIGTAIVVYEAT